MLTPSFLLDVLLLPAFYLALGSWVVVSLVLFLRGLTGWRKALALARARQRLQEVSDRRLEPASEQSALVALVATLPEAVLLPLAADAPDAAVLAFMRRRLDDFLGILDGHLQDRSFVIGDRPTIADISLMAYLSFPANEAGYDFAVSHPAVSAWLSRMASLPGWQAPYDLLPGKRLHCYV